MKPKVVFLLSTISQPRCIKRIRGFINAGFEIEIYGFDRGVYNVNSKIDGHVINILGFAESGKGYIKKYIYAQKALKNIFNKFLYENVIYYAFAFDIALICKMHSKKKKMFMKYPIWFTGISIISFYAKSLQRWIDDWLSSHC